MEKKSIGRFIAALRKANGMTQKELAEQLNVSDKAVSRWERDESAPDLSLIPVIAEIFHVTSDEILRGERVSHQENQTEKYSEKGKKQIAMLLNKSKNKFKMFSLVSAHIAAVGLLVAMVMNFVVLNAYTGFFLACMFYLLAVVLLGIGLLNVLPSIQMEEADEKTVTACRNEIVKWFFGTMVIVVSIFMFSLPLVVLAEDAYMGLTFESWMGSGLPLTAATAVAGIVLWWMISMKKLQASEQQVAVARLKLKYAKRTAIVLFITLIAQTLFYGVFRAEDFISGTRFRTYEEFVEYMETRVGYDEVINEGFTVNVEITEKAYYGDDGNEISFEDDMTEYLYDEDGKLLCSYINRNKSVASIYYEGNDKEDEYIPVTVYTHNQIAQGQFIIDVIITPIWVLIYIIEATVGVLVYFKNKKKHT